MEKEQKVTPMMAQYLATKEKNPDYLLFYRKSFRRTGHSTDETRQTFGRRHPDVRCSVSRLRTLFGKIGAKRI